MSLKVTVVSPNPDTGIVIVRDAVGNEFEVDARVRPKGMGFPARGERWTLARKGTTYVFEFQIGAPGVAIVDGSRTGMHPVAVQMLDAMSQHGFVFDRTIGVPVPVVHDDISDPVTEDPEDEQWEDGGDEGVPAPEGPEDNPDDEQPPKDHNDDVKPGSEVAADLFTVITYNLKYTVGPTRARADVRRVLAQADLVGFQEMHGSQRKAVLESMPDNWGLYQPAAGPEPPIMWREGVFDLLASNNESLSPFDGPGTARPERVINWVRLRHRGTKDQLVAVNYHWENAAAFQGFFDPRSRPSSPRHIERYKEQMDQVIPLLRSLRKYGPIIFTGDWNVSFRKDMKYRNPGLPFEKMRSLGMRSNWDFNGLPDIGTHGGIHGGVIDGMYLHNKVPGQVKFVGSRVLRGYASDHRPVLVRTRIKNLKGKR